MIKVTRKHRFYDDETVRFKETPVKTYRSKTAFLTKPTNQKRIVLYLYIELCM